VSSSDSEATVNAKVKPESQTNSGNNTGGSQRGQRGTWTTFLYGWFVSPTFALLFAVAQAARNPSFLRLMLPRQIVRIQCLISFVLLGLVWLRKFEQVWGYLVAIFSAVTTFSAVFSVVDLGFRRGPFGSPSLRRSTTRPVSSGPLRSTLGRLKFTLILVSLALSFGAALGNEFCLIIGSSAFIFVYYDPRDVQFGTVSTFLQALFIIFMYAAIGTFRLGRSFFGRLPISIGILSVPPEHWINSAVEAYYDRIANWLFPSMLVAHLFEVVGLCLRFDYRLRSVPRAAPPRLQTPTDQRATGTDSEVEGVESEAQAKELESLAPASPEIEMKTVASDCTNSEVSTELKQATLRAPTPKLTTPGRVVPIYFITALLLCAASYSLVLYIDAYSISIKFVDDQQYVSAALLVTEFSFIFGIGWLATRRREYKEFISYKENWVQHTGDLPSSGQTFVSPESAGAAA